MDDHGTSSQHPTSATGPAWDAEAVAGALREGRVRGVRMWPSAPADAVFLAGAEQAGWRCLTLDTEGVAAKADYIAACRDQIPLPDYLGRNWDALEEALGDLGVDAAGAGVTGVLVVWRNWSEFATAEPANFQVALAIWRSVASDWRERLAGAGVVLAVDTSDVASRLPENVADEITGISRVRNG